MARSLGLLAVIIAVLFFIGPARSLILPGAKDRMPAIDYAGYVRGFNETATTPAVVPAGLPASWRANAGTFDAKPSPHLHIGWAVPDAGFAGLDESTGDSSSLLREVTGTPSLRVAGMTNIDGAAWSVRRSSRGETVFTRDVGGVFVIVTGNATDPRLRLLAASLR
jgi:hypothetical protein